MTFTTRRPEAELDDLLRALAEDESRVQTPAHVEGAVMARFQAPPRRGRGEAGRAVLRRGAALAAGLAIAVALARLGQHLERATAQPARQPATLVLVGEPILADERVRVVRMRMPASTLTALGVRAVDGAAETVDLDVVVGEDGVARAVRIGM